jgi:DNA-binding NarL/FixJ family response regulator
LVQAVEALLDERPFFTSKIARLVLDGYLRSGEDSGAPAAGALSARERHIVQLLAEGNNNKEVARALQLSVKTVETHRSNIMRKMEFDSLPDLVRYAIRNKIVDA